MLYVFYVGSGTMMTFEMSLAMSPVAVLQKAIVQSCNISVENQVLLISGGATLDSQVQVCNYGAGMDTNPIFLFSKCTGEGHYPPMDYSDSDSELNMRERIEACANMSMDFQSLTARTQLARELAETAILHKRQCSDLVDSQHLQQQGWAAVVANLEDTTVAFKRHMDLLQNEAQQYFQSRPSYQKLLQSFPEAVDLLAKVPIVEPFNSQVESEDESSRQHQTLFTRYCTEPRAALEKMAEQCKKWIQQFNETTMASFDTEVKGLLQSAENSSMKEVKGIEERLFRLNKMMESAKSVTDDQIKFAEYLSHHQSTVPSTNDKTLLPDLCLAHQQHLGRMLNSYTCLRDIRNRLAKAKIELCENLKTRISWVGFIQNEIFKLNNMVAIYRENLRRLFDHLDVIQQIHLAPAVYAKTLAEIHRRKNFSNRFLKWAKNLSEQALDLYTKEGKARRDFHNSRTENFVNSLFPGMDDLPPTFATVCPEPFDQLLPDISQEDLEKLKNQLPELADMMEVFPMEPMPNVSHKSVVTDSAFSSEVPSSQAAVPSGSCASLQGGQLLRTETLSSFGAGECVGPMSPTSSPFEEPFLPPPPTDMEVTMKHVKPSTSKKVDEGVECKRLHLTEAVVEKEVFSPIVEEQNNVESDGDEFERVDDVPKLYEAFVTCSETSESNDEEGHKHRKASEPISVPSGDAQLETSKVHKADALEPCHTEERLRTPDSMVTSHDFQSPDYFIDDSMPSSYTESTGTSALGRAQQRVKSHHVIVAELQHQLDEKHSALVGSQGSLKMSRSNILLHGKISALQRFVQDIQSTMKLDLQLLRDHVMEQRSSVTEELSSIMMNVGASITDILSQVQLEKENAVNLAIQEKEDTYYQIIKQKQEKFECDTRELQTEIEECRKELAHTLTFMEEMRQNHENKLKQVTDNYEVEKAEIVKGMMLEHELEFESLREETTRQLQAKENEISELREAVSEKQTHIHMLGIERETLETDFKQKVLNDQEQWIEAMEAKYKTNYESALKVALEEKQSLESEQIEILKRRISTIESEAFESFQKNLTMKQEELGTRLRVQFEEEMKCIIEKKDAMLKAKEQELKELLEQQTIEHRKEIETLQTQLRLVQSVTAIERMDAVQGGLPSTEDISDPVSFRKEICALIQRFMEMTESSISMEALVSELSTLKSKHERMTAHVQAQHDATISELKVQYRAEQQIAFNEAINKVTLEKDKVIEDMQSRISFLERKIENANTVIKSHFEKDMERMAVSTTGEMRHSGAKSKTYKFQDASKILLEVRNVIDTPLMMPVDTSFMEDKVRDLERELKLEKLKTQNMLDQIQKKEHTDKLSVLTCNHGDIALFFYEEKYNNFIAFHYGPAPHFLHPDSLEALNLKIPPEPESSWALTVVVDKEYCQAKKPRNRYNVSPGSKFYRVKVKAWDHEDARKRMMHPPMAALSWMCSASITKSTPNAFAVSADSTNSSQMSSSAI